MQAAFKQLAACPPLDPGQNLVQCLTLVAAAYQDLEAKGAPGVLLVDLQEVVASGVPDLMGHLTSYLATGMNRLQHATDDVSQGAVRLRSVAQGAGDPRLPDRMRVMLMAAMDNINETQAQVGCCTALRGPCELVWGVRRADDGCRQL